MSPALQRKRETEDGPSFVVNFQFCTGDCTLNNRKFMTAMVFTTVNQVFCYLKYLFISTEKLIIVLLQELTYVVSVYVLKKALKHLQSVRLYRTYYNWKFCFTLSGRSDLTSYIA